MPTEKASPEEIREMVLAFVVGEYLEEEEAPMISDETPLISGGILDSIATIKLVAALEERFGVLFDATDVKVEHLNTIRKITDLLELKLRA